MRPGHYRTEHGSTVYVRTKNAGSWVAGWDKFEEPHACADCKNLHVDIRERALVWECDYCGGGMSKLKFVSKP